LRDFRRPFATIFPILSTQETGRSGRGITFGRKHRYGIFIPPGRPARQGNFFAAGMQTAFSTILRNPNYKPTSPT